MHVGLEMVRGNEPAAEPPACGDVQELGCPVVRVWRFGASRDPIAAQTQLS